MAETLIILLTAHLLGDFVFQPNWIIKHKCRVGVQFLHAVIVATISWVLLGSFQVQILIFIFVTHLIIDLVKAWIDNDSLAVFLIDQVLHLSVLLYLSLNFPDAAKDGWLIKSLGADNTHWYYVTLCIVSGVILAITAGGIMIGKATKPFLDEIKDKNIDGLKNGGRYIGWLERSLVMLLILTNMPSGIGFLLTAKSILRFGEIKDSSHRKLAEYIIIGTFLSFGWGLLIAALTLIAMKHWQP